MTAELRLVTAVEARVDAVGDAEMRRTWTFRNCSAGDLDLTDFVMFVDVTTMDATVHSVKDAAGTDIRYSTKTVGSKTRLTCHFSKVLKAHENFALTIRYRHPRYLVSLPQSDMWVLHEYFERLGEFEDVDFTQEEPQQFEFRVAVQDPRHRFLFWPTPWRRWRLETPQQAPRAFDKGACSFTYQFGLRSHDKPYDVHIVSSVDDRSLFMTAGGMTGSAIGAVVIERALLTLF